MTLEKIIRDKIVELEYRAEYLIQEIDDQEEPDFEFYAIYILNDILAEYKKRNRDDKDRK
jgi:hypothetical protein